MLCPTCSTEMAEMVILKRRGLSVGACPNCAEMAQELANGEVVPVTEALSAFALGDDRMRAAISRPAPINLRSFLDSLDVASHNIHLELATNSGTLRTLLAQIENRLDEAQNRFAELGFISDKAEEGLRYLREARDLVSTAPSRNRGPRPERT